MHLGRGRALPAIKLHLPSAVLLTRSDHTVQSVQLLRFYISLCAQRELI